MLQAERPWTRVCFMMDVFQARVQRLWATSALLTCPIADRAGAIAVFGNRPCLPRVNASSCARAGSIQHDC